MKVKISITKLVLIIFFSSLFGESGCGNSSNFSGNREDDVLGEIILGPEGGELTLPGIKITFPAGAVDRLTRITVRTASGFPSGSPGPVFDLGPTGTWFHQRPLVAIQLPEVVCDNNRRFHLATVVENQWEPISGSSMANHPCRVLGEVEHFSPFGPIPADDPLSQAAQNYFLEAVLAGVYHHQAQSQYRDFRSDGLLTKGTSRFLLNPVFCIIGYEDRPDTREAAGEIVKEAVSALTDDHYGAIFACPSGKPPAPLNLDECSDHSWSTLPGDQINIFLSEYCYNRGISCHAEGPIGKARGGEIIGGFVDLYVSPVTGTVSSSSLKHELGHVFGLNHTWGDPDIMSYRESTPDYASHEREAIAILYQLNPGLGIRDLIHLGVIQDAPEILNEPPSITHTEIIIDDSRSWLHDNHAAVGEGILLVGQRLTLAFMTEPYCPIFRGFGYAPPVIHFGPVDIVAESGDFLIKNRYHPGGWPSGILKTTVPAGAGIPLSLTTRGQTADFPLFAVDGATVPDPEQTPLSVIDLSCDRLGGGNNILTWTLPATFADGTTPFDPAGATARVFRNGVQVEELGAVTTSFFDTWVYPAHETDLYQVFLVNSATGQVGIPSSVCTLDPRLDTGEITLLVIDRTGSMTTLRDDGTTRFQGVVGPLADPAVPRAFAALDEIFGAALTPRVAIYSFNFTDGIIDEVAELVGETFTSERAVAEDALLNIRDRGAMMTTPLVDTMCFSAEFLLDEFRSVGTGTATLRIFTDGEENMSIGLEPCPSSCAADFPGGVPWDNICRPGTCPGVFPAFYRSEPENCTDCQIDLYRQYCDEVINFYVEYFGPAGPFSPLPPDAGYFMDLAKSTGGLFTYNADDGSTVLGLPADLPPVAQLWESFQVECEGTNGTPVMLYGSAVDELPDSALEFTWTGTFVEGEGFAHGHAVTVTFPVGLNQIQLIVSDEHQYSLPAMAAIDVVDTTPPELAVSLSPDELWPPNHRMRDITATIVVNDQCDSHVDVTLVSIVSDEPEDAVGGGDGATSPDIDGAEFGADDREFQVRAERQGAGDGRTYVVTYEAIDDAGNRSIREATIFVPHNR